MHIWRIKVKLNFRKWRTAVNAQLRGIKEGEPRMRAECWKRDATNATTIRCCGVRPPWKC